MQESSFPTVSAALATDGDNGGDSDSCRGEGDVGSVNVNGEVVTAAAVMNERNDRRDDNNDAGGLEPRSVSDCEGTDRAADRDVSNGR